MLLKPEVLDRLLLSKSFLERMRFQPAAVHDRHSLASNIISAHDAAELAIAAICDQLGCLPQKGNSYLMEYFAPLKEKLQLTGDVHAKEYFRNLNDTRNKLKHQGLYPDGRQWARVGELVFQHIGKWCWDFLTESFAELDESALISDPAVKSLYDDAQKRASQGDYKGCLERLAIALNNVFVDNSALRGFEAGKARPEDAICLSGFGVHGNDFLALQQFLPYVPTSGSSLELKWKQSEYGHAGNWNEANVEFCLRTFVDVAIKLQGAEWVPGPLRRDALYEQQIEAIEDNVEIWHFESKAPRGTGLAAIFPAPPKQEDLVKKVVVTLKRGDKIKAIVSLATKEPESGLYGALAGRQKDPELLEVIIVRVGFGTCLASQVKVTCVPRQDDVIKQYFPWLPEFEWEPE